MEEKKPQKETFDLLIIYWDGSRKTVINVEAYYCDGTINCFWFRKNGLKSYIPIDQVMFFGRASDYTETRN